MTAEIPWLLVAFAAGSIFGGALVISLLVLLLSETRTRIDTRFAEEDR